MDQSIISKQTCIVLGGGIGNVMQALPTVSAISCEHKVDVVLMCHQAEQVADLIRSDSIGEIYTSSLPKKEYDYHLQGPFCDIEIRAKKVIKPRIRWDQHLPEHKVYYDMAEQIKIKTPTQKYQLELLPGGYDPGPDTVVIYPGSKHNWAMKRWDKFDILAREFKYVLVVGTAQDIKSHGDPTWIKRKWNWPDQVEIYYADLSDMAYTISLCAAFIGNDGGLSHVAASTGIPTFVLFGPSSPTKNKPYGENAHSIHTNLECQPCQFKKGLQYFGEDKSNCPFKMKCMTGLSVKQVKQKVVSIVGDSIVND